MPFPKLSRALRAVFFKIVDYRLHVTICNETRRAQRILHGADKSTHIPPSSKTSYFKLHLAFRPSK